MSAYKFMDIAHVWDVQIKILQDMKQQVQRRYLRERLAVVLSTGVPTLAAYAIIGEQEGISAEYVRKMISHRKDGG